MKISLTKKEASKLLDYLRNGTHADVGEKTDCMLCLLYHKVSIKL